MRRLILSISIFISFTQLIFAQQDSLDIVEDEILVSEQAKELEIRPFVSLGGGPMTYYGDMFRYPGTNAMMGNMGLNMGIGIHVTDYLNASLFFSSGWIAFSENTISNHTNFKSEILSGGLLFSYNFDNLFKNSPKVHPLFILGISNVEFNSKTDLMDAKGRVYNYWSDGSIRDLPENSANADQAVLLIRDNYYETDLRSLNTDDLGNYELSSLAIPVGIGADITLDYGFSLQLSSIMNFTFTDNIDNISSGANDRYLYTSVTLSYDIPAFNENKRKKLEESTSLLEDEDQDGVPDLNDDCPFTPEGVVVDEKGCPLDGDGDFVPDYKDLELNTLSGSFVDTSGVTYTDDDLYKLYLTYMDTIGEFNVIKTVYTSNEKGRRTVHTPRPHEKYFSVQVATSTQDQSIEQIGKILSIPNVEIRNDSNQTLYLVGKYDDLEGAIEQKILLEVDGIDGVVISIVDDKQTIIGPEAQAIEDAYRLEGGFSGNESLISKDVIYRVQIGAFKNPISKNVFEGVNDLIELQGDDGLTRYLTGSYRNIQDAANRKIDVLLEGFEGSFIVAYRNGQRISLETAGHKVEKVGDVPQDSMDKEKVSFKVQVGAYKDHIPADVMDKLITIGDVKTVRQEGLTKYLVGDYKTYDEAVKRKNELLKEGLDGFVVGSFNDKIITVDEAKEILNK